MIVTYDSKKKYKKNLHSLLNPQTTPGSQATTSEPDQCSSPQALESAAHPAMYKRPRSDPPYADSWVLGSLMTWERCLSTTNTWGCRVRQEGVVVSVAAGLTR